MDNKNYQIDSGEGSSKLKDDSGVIYSSVQRSRIESIIESESQIASKTYEAMDETEFIKRMSERFPWITA